MSDDDEGAKPYDVGYGKPPLHTRYPKLHSGNRKGRPEGRHVRAPHDAVLGQMVTIRESGVARKVTAAEAFLLHLAQMGLAGDVASARSLLNSFANVRGTLLPEESEPVVVIIDRADAAFDYVNTTLKRLEMAKVGKSTKLAHWLVEAALARLGDRVLTPWEQREVWGATRMPKKMRWPDWWTERRGSSRKYPCADGGL